MLSGWMINPTSAKRNGPFQCPFAIGCVWRSVCRNYWWCPHDGARVLPPDQPSPGMESNEFTYEGDDVTITWDQKRCIHAEACVHGLPDVFDPNRRPWIDPDQADADAIEDVVTRCPTGALHVRRGDTNPETPPSSNHMTVFPNGPLLLRGRIEVCTPDGETLLRDTRVALCRCGLSQNKPLCDGSHDEAFQDDGALKATRLSDGETEGATLRVQVAHGGPLLLQGPLTLEGADGTSCSGSKGALCRCGASHTKPFCDGSHADVDFDAA